MQMSEVGLKKKKPKKPQNRLPLVVREGIIAQVHFSHVSLALVSFLAILFIAVLHQY